MKYNKSIYLQILSCLSIIILSFVIVSVLFYINVKDTEKKIQEIYDIQMQSLASNFETQVSNWGGICYSIYNNATFKSYVYEPKAITEYELVSLLKGYENSTLGVTEIMIYNREADSVITKSGKVDSYLFFSKEISYQEPDVFMDFIHNKKAMLIPWYSEDEEPLLTYVYPIQNVSPYQTKQDIYILLYMPKEQLDLYITNTTGNLSGRYEIFQNDETLYTTDLFLKSVDLEEEARVLEYGSKSGRYRFNVHVYPSAFLKQLKDVQMTYVRALIFLVLIGIMISIVHGILSLKPMKQITDELDSAHDMMRHQALSALLDGMPANDERLKTAGLAGKDACYCVLIISLPDTMVRLTDSVLSLLSKLPEQPSWRCRALEYERLSGIVVILAMENYNSQMLEEILDMLQSNICRLGVEPVISVGGVKEEAVQLHMSFGEAVFLNNNNHIPGKGILRHQDSSSPDANSVPVTELALLSQSLQMGLSESSVNSIYILRDKLNYMQSTIAKYYTCSQITSIVLNAAQNNQMEIAPVKLNEISKFLMTNGFWQSLQEITYDICKLVSEKNKALAISEADEVMRYISDHCLSYDIGLEQVAEHFHISMNHVGLLVKRVTGHTFREHLITMRMDIAAKLLCETNYEIQKISAKIGYASVPHFIKTFKGSYQVTPAQYRKMKKSIG